MQNHFKMRTKHYELRFTNVSVHFSSSFLLANFFISLLWLMKHNKIAEEYITNMKTPVLCVIYPSIIKPCTHNLLCPWRDRECDVTAGHTNYIWTLEDIVFSDLSFGRSKRRRSVSVPPLLTKDRWRSSGGLASCALWVSYVRILGPLALSWSSYRYDRR